MDVITMACLDEIRDAVEELLRDRDTDEFTIHEVFLLLEKKGSPCKENTVRTYITSGKMTINAPAHHDKTYSDFERVGRGVYRRAR
ncbi:MAG: hypothetical protein IAE80_20105 [Anaerolinea sp.]|nr:hypothetical protein [Anaerolinea sp.]